jgi:hypothetical protein
MVGCGVNMTPQPEVTKPEEAQALVDSMVYVKNKRGLCFGITTVSRMSTSGSVAVNQSVVEIDCKKVDL